MIFPSHSVTYNNLGDVGVCKLAEFMEISSSLKELRSVSCLLSSSSYFFTMHVFVPRYVGLHVLASFPGHYLA